METITMTVKEANRLSVMRQIDKKVFGLRKASEELGISLRQLKRLRKRYRAEGEQGLISRRRGRDSPNRTDPKLKEAVINLLYRKEYEGFGPTLLTEKLQELHGYHLSNETIRHWMIERGLWKPKRRKERKVHQRRARRARIGELIQADGSIHLWFEDRGERCALIVFVDDATSKITAAQFVKTESTEAYLSTLETHLKAHGRPLAFYTDRHSVFITSKETRLQERDTHFRGVLRALDIKLICARSPQAKGRVERANGTLQDRLIKEMRLKGINTMQEGNEFLPQFIEKYNERFGKKPQSEENAHRELRASDDLEKLFARSIVKKLSKNLSFQHEGVLYQVRPKMPNRFRCTHVTVLQRKGKPLLIEGNGISYPYTEWSDEKQQITRILDSKELEAYWPTKTTKRPGKHHPWR